MFPDENKALSPEEGERIEKPSLPLCLWKTVVLQQASQIKDEQLFNAEFQ